MDQGAIRNLQFFDLHRTQETIADPGWVSSIQLFIQHIWGSWSSTATFITLLFLVVVVYTTIRMHQIRKIQLKQLEDLRLTAIGTDVEESDERWGHIETLIDSPNENDWRQAIIEADIILDELTTAMGYHGDTLGEKLKGIEKSDFSTLDKAWEAHKVRNKIAHEGMGLDISHREARRIIMLYEDVFKEFHYI